MEHLDPDDSEIASLEAQVMELEATEARLLPQLETCQESLRRLRLSLAHLRNKNLPISRLPDEVLALIFEAGHACDDLTNFDASYLEHANGRPLPFAILVSHVSRTWRDVAIRDPFLWTTIQIVYTKPQSLYLMYASRSKSRSLNIHFLCDVENVHDFKPSILQLQRCSHLAIFCDWYQPAIHISRRLETETAPRLLSLKIDMGEPNETYEDFFPAGDHQLFRIGAPLLSSVELYRITLWSCKPPLAALTTLRLYAFEEEMSFDEFCEVFGAMANTLADLRLDGIIFRGGSVNKDFTVDFPALISLEIRYPDYERDMDDDDYIKKLCDCINAPALESLSLYSMDGEQFHAAMVSLRLQRIRNTTAGLESLSLHDVVVDGYTDDFALACPDLSDLTLISHATATTVLTFVLESDKIASNTDTELLWPNLHTLSVSSCEDEILRALVLGRKAVGHPLIELGSSSYFARADWYHQDIS